MKIGVLTSTRADFGIYLPLLKSLKNDSYFELEIIAFGTHLSPFHGFTLNQISNDGFEVPFRIESVLASDTPNAISTAMALTSMKFADFWKNHQQDFDLVFCLGDRYEMFAAVIAAIPYNIPFAHLHGGERTMGAIDNVFRHAITLASKYHFVSCKENGERVAQLIETTENIFNVGSLSLDKLTTLKLLSKQEFKVKFGVDINQPTILVTVHPETITPFNSIEIANELANTLLILQKYQVIITLPNSDTLGTAIRDRFIKLSKETKGRIMCFENLGSQGYFSAMMHCSFLLGNTSSGIIEAASFGKWVINLGNRQKGRKQSANCLNIEFNKSNILEAIKKIELLTEYKGGNIYFQKNVALKICNILKNLT